MLEGNLLGNLGLLHAEQGRMGEAHLCYEQALSLCREVGNLRFESVVLGNLANLYKDQGRREEARPLYEEALVGFERTIAYVTGLANVRDAIPFPRTPGTAKY